MNVWSPTSEPASRMSRSSCGCWAAIEPTTKNVAGTWWRRSTSRTCGVQTGSGPSSKVSEIVFAGMRRAHRGGAAGVDDRPAVGDRRRDLVVGLLGRHRAGGVDADLRAGEPVDQQQAAEHQQGDHDEQHAGPGREALPSAAGGHRAVRVAGRREVPGRGARGAVARHGQTPIEVVRGPMSSTAGVVPDPEPVGVVVSVVVSVPVVPVPVPVPVPPLPPAVPRPAVPRRPGARRRARAARRRAPARATGGR